jgi:hypothetical protein
MERDKLIEEMAKAVCHLDRTCDECMTSFECKAMMYAKRFYDAGYRKASEVARNIFGNLRILGHIDFDGNFCIRKDSFEELEKEYTEEGK